MEAAPGDGHLGADANPAIEVINIGVVHADTALRDGSSDGPWRIGAVDPVEARAEI